MTLCIASGILISEVALRELGITLPNQIFTTGSAAAASGRSIAPVRVTTRPFGITSRRRGRGSQQELAQPADTGTGSQPGSHLDGERSHFGLGVPCVRGEEEFPGRGAHGPRPVADRD
jgi:hypothetical protein